MDDVFSLKGNDMLYQVLGVEKSSSAGQIKRAYHKLAIQCHPDKSSDPKDAERFKEISFAYNILSDDEQRKLYDNKTLRTHLEGTKTKEYDPMMDPNVELSQEDLCKFVEKVRKDHENIAQAQKEFDAKKREEMERRAEYDRLHPEFKMPDTRTYTRGGGDSHPSEPHPAMAENYSAMQATQLNHRTTADIKEALQRLEGNNGQDEKDPLADLRSAKPSSNSSKHLMMQKFRSKRQEEGINTVDQVTKVRPEHVAHLDDKKYGFVKQQTAQPDYTETVAKKVEERSNFDYATFVKKDYVDGGVMGDAILADALNDYDPRQ